MGKPILDKDYYQFLEDMKRQVTLSKSYVTQSINKELILLYHHIGTSILRAQEKQGWGAKIIDQLSKDLKAAFPEMKGFSPRNLKYIRKLAEEYPDREIVQQTVAQLPWGHNVLLMNKIQDKKAKLFYIRQVVEHSWSRNTLEKQINMELHKRQGQAITNFSNQLPTYQSDLAHDTLKDPYIFDFLNISQNAQEREVEKELCKHMEKFLLELGAGFAFVGRQHHLEVAQQDFYIDLLFYHLKLRCFVVIELKDKEFKPEYAGKMNFYLSAVDDLIKHEADNPSIGLILCKTKNNVLAEYMTKPIGLAEYRLEDALPEDVKTVLPTIEELELELSKDLNFDIEGNN